MIETNSQEKLYLANSEHLIKLINRCNMQELLDEAMYENGEESKQNADGMPKKQGFLFNLFSIDG